ncbi:ABC transporter ATP-binding protein [Glutamicibacter bergerei]|uniref:ABC transporter ATP-binding protein n=1 Tax=Glutamicibacter ardleyensis TaxID=225894 RepID=A0ABQ2D7C3_9MICC|nr:MULTISPECIES: ABC transporter ATP-binding protein [Glutamicibacter]PCC37337.1 ABC transporter ATP-binding protein [Glutamicibacter sp. BW77]GGJ48732.1 ABC transporter ATP-binding protein [Glutamicibacter ardleyensis]
MQTLIKTEAVSLTGLTKTFSTSRTKVQAVKGIDLQIPTGQIVAFLGPNGAGKTTTIDMILGLTKPTAGAAKILGLDPPQAVSSGRVSAVLQTGGLLRDMTVKETVTVIASMHGKSDRINEVMERTGLTRIAKRRVGKCSGGEQQRIKFALALLPDPDVLILDEPTAGMDVMARREFWSTMRSEATQGRTVIFATHYLEEAQNFAERTILMSQGKIVADGATAELRQLISGRTLSASFTSEDQGEQAATFDQSVQITERNGSRFAFQCQNSDRFAAALLGEYQAYDLEISSPSLEDAFIQLTKDAS